VIGAYSRPMQFGADHGFSVGFGCHGVIPVYNCSEIVSFIC